MEPNTRSRSRTIGFGAGAFGLLLAGWVWASPPWADRADFAGLAAEVGAFGARLERIERKLDHVLEGR
mgnify:CR=1 FL=1